MKAGSFRDAFGLLLWLESGCRGLTEGLRSGTLSGLSLACCQFMFRNEVLVRWRCALAFPVGQLCDL